MTLWGSDTVRDVAESVGIINLNKDVTSALCRDVEYRMSMVLEQALKFMRHSQRTVLWASDISEALKMLDIEPLYGYESTRPLKYGEASIGPGQPLFYVEDEEMDFEKLINAPLPKVPREMSFTAHWLAVEGVQPTIPQNPLPSDPRALDLLPKSSATTSSTGTGGSALASTSFALAAQASALDLASGGAAVGGAGGAASSGAGPTTKPQVKHILSKELQLYFERVCASILDESQPEYRIAGLSSLREDPGLGQLVPYFVQFVAEKVTHNLRDLFVLTQMMHMTDALTRNVRLNLAPYVASLVPPILTCLIGRNLGSSPSALSSAAMNGISSTSNANGSATPTNNSIPTSHFPLRTHAATLLSHLVTRYSKHSHTLRPRLARSLLKTFLDPRKPLGSHYGAILGFAAVDSAPRSNDLGNTTNGEMERSAGGEVIRQLVVPNLKAYGDEVLGPALYAGEDATTDASTSVKKEEAERVMGAIFRVLRRLVESDVADGDVIMNGHGDGEGVDALKDKLVDKVGEVIGNRLVEKGDAKLAKAVIDA